MSRARLIVTVIAMLLLAAVPPVATAIDEPFFYDMFIRIMILALAAMSLDLILGFGGMVSFGHAAYMGVGAYAVGILSYYGVADGYLQFTVAIAASALIALIIGAMSLRTSGVYFIMITLAFAQMLYFLGVSLEEFGGDDGMGFDKSEFGGWLDLYDPDTFYYLVFAILLLFLIVSLRLVNSRFGRVIRGAKSNTERMQAIGFPVYRYRLAAFVIAGTMCGIAGALYANLNEFVSPDYMHWTRSGELMIMVVIGGLSTLVGPIIGAATFLLLEEYLPEWMNDVVANSGEHWMVVFGPLLILIVLFAKGGLFKLTDLLPGSNR